MNYNYNFPFSKNVIELGGGDRPYFRPNLDVRSGPTVDIVADFNKKLPIENEQYDGVFSSYCIEHISWRNVRLFISETYRILKNGGKIVFLTANTKRQMHWVLSQDEFNDDSSCIIFGDQNYDENTHRNFLCPEFAVKLMREAGFENIIILPFGDLGTDMIIEANKPNKIVFDRKYFDVGGAGCTKEFYWDYPENWIIYNKVKELNPLSVVELGCSRGYFVKRFNDDGIESVGIDSSEHCKLTRVTNKIFFTNLIDEELNFLDKQYDLIFSNCFWENLTENEIEIVLNKIGKIGERGLHIIKTNGNQGINGYTIKPIQWWQSKMPQNHTVVEYDDFCKGNLLLNVPAGDHKIKFNFGSFINMFYNGWINTDVLNMEQFASKYKYKFIQVDATRSLPFLDESIDLAYSSHMLEHLSFKDGLNFLKECFRCMKKGSTLRIAVPDAEKLINYYQKNEMNTFDELNEGCAKSELETQKLWAFLFEGHKIAYDFKGMKKLGEKAGFVVEKKYFNQGHEQIVKETIDMFPDISLYVEMKKP